MSKFFVLKCDFCDEESKSSNGMSAPGFRNIRVDNTREFVACEKCFVERLPELKKLMDSK